MKKVVALILNRNLPDITDELAEWILQQHSEYCDLEVIENGSDSNKRSKYATIINKSSLGPARGINEALKKVLAKGYDYFWVNYNDARYKNSHFLSYALAAMQRDPAIGMFFPYWPGNTRTFGDYSGLSLVSYTDIIGFLISRQALEVCQHFRPIPLVPLWDSRNFSNHNNILATFLALYEAKFCAVTSEHLTATELAEPAARKSVIARGFDDQAWKTQKGPADVDDWLSTNFPNLKGTIKDRKAKLIEQIERLIIKQFPDSLPWSVKIRYWIREKLIE